MPWYLKPWFWRWTIRHCRPNTIKLNWTLLPSLLAQLQSVLIVLHKLWIRIETLWWYDNGPCPNWRWSAERTVHKLKQNKRVVILHGLFKIVFDSGHFTDQILNTGQHDHKCFFCYLLNEPFKGEGHFRRHSQLQHESDCKAINEKERKRETKANNYLIWIQSMFYLFE